MKLCAALLLCVLGTVAFAAAVPAGRQQVMYIKQFRPLGRHAAGQQAMLVHRFGAPKYASRRSSSAEQEVGAFAAGDSIEGASIIQDKPVLQDGDAYSLAEAYPAEGDYYEQPEVSAPQQADAEHHGDAFDAYQNDEPAAPARPPYHDAPAAQHHNNHHNNNVQPAAHNDDVTPLQPNSISSVPAHDASPQHHTASVPHHQSAVGGASVPHSTGPHQQQTNHHLNTPSSAAPHKDSPQHQQQHDASDAAVAAPPKKSNKKKVAATPVAVQPALEIPESDDAGHDNNGGGDAPFVPSATKAGRPSSNNNNNGGAAGGAPQGGNLPHVYFPMNFGRTSGGVIAVANSYSTGSGSAASHAVAYGSAAPAQRRRSN